jgi:hypothetical protein
MLTSVKTPSAISEEACGDSNHTRTLKDFDDDAPLFRFAQGI